VDTVLVDTVLVDTVLVGTIVVDHLLPREPTMRPLLRTSGDIREHRTNTH